MSAVYIDIVNQRIHIASEFSDKDKCKTIPGARWNKEVSRWHVPISWAACKQLRATFGDRLQIGPRLMEWATNESMERVLPSLKLRLATDDKTPVFAYDQLYPFQRAGVQFMLTSKNCILGDPMGCGKTVQTIVAARSTETKKPKLVICPNSMKRTWGREINVWDPGAPVFVVEGPAGQRARTLKAAQNTDEAWVIINWESVRLHSRLAPYGSLALTEAEKTPKELNAFGFGIVIADEAHKMKDPKSKQTRAAWAIAHQAGVEYRWALTGTPLTKAPDTLWPVLHFVYKDEWPVKSSFIDRYTLNVFNAWGGLEVWGIQPEMEPEFQSIFEPRFRRMPKEIVLPQLPPVIRQTRYVEMGTKQEKAYQTMVDSMWAEDESGTMVIASNPISQLTRLTQYASAMVSVTEDGPRLSDPSCKLDQLMIDLDEYLDDGEGVVVFAQSRQLIEMAQARLEKAKITYSVVKGGQTNDQRQNAIDAFQNGTVPVILVVIAAGGVGITLTRGRIAIFLQRSWSNVDMQQAIGRVHRIGSEIHSSVVIVDYVTKGTVEIGQIQVLAGKEGMLEEVIRDRATVHKLLKGMM